MVRVFINGKAFDAQPGTSALDALRAADAEEARRVEAGERLIADSRGLPVDAAGLVFAGAVYRTMRALGVGRAKRGDS